LRIAKIKKMPVKLLIPEGALQGASAQVRKPENDRKQRVNTMKCDIYSGSHFLPSGTRKRERRSAKDAGAADGSASIKMFLVQTEH
jgi:hypothetical protein